VAGDAEPQGGPAGDEDAPRINTARPAAYRTPVAAATARLTAIAARGLLVGMPAPTPDPAAVRLLHGPYRASKVRTGDRAVCHLRGAAVVVTSIASGRIPWPRCRALDSRGGSGLLVDDELLRAVRTEAAVAVAWWWGVPPTCISRWRRLLGVERFTAGSARLQKRNGARGAAALRSKRWTQAERAAKRDQARALRLVRHTLGKRWPDRPWTPGEVKLLGTMPDAAVAVRVGRSRSTVRRERVRRRIPAHGLGAARRG
jgi:hypothetical protein